MAKSSKPPLRGKNGGARPSAGRERLVPGEETVNYVIRMPRPTAEVLRGRTDEVRRALMRIAEKPMPEPEPEEEVTPLLSGAIPLPETISTRLGNVLAFQKIRDLRQLTKHRRIDIYTWKNIGAKTLAELEDLLEENGLSLRED